MTCKWNTSEKNQKQNELDMNWGNSAKQSFQENELEMSPLYYALYMPYACLMYALQMPNTSLWLPQNKALYRNRTKGCLS